MYSAAPASQPPHDSTSHDAPLRQTRVLVVDDDQQIRELIADYLARFGMQVDGVEDGFAMRRCLQQLQDSGEAGYDLILLDLMLPGDDGLTLCRELRSHSSIPIIMLTARGEVTDRIVGLEMGADDYLVKPFDPRELAARIRTLLRRAQPSHPLPGNEPVTGEDGPPNSDSVTFSNWRLSLSLRQLWAPDGVIVPLSNAEFRLLQCFIERPWRVLSRDQLMDNARGRALEAFDRSIDLLVSRLRQKLRDDPKENGLIRTVRGEGYVFASKVSWGQAHRNG
jgi:two-component system OmpR family response regulator